MEHCTRDLTVLDTALGYVQCLLHVSSSDAWFRVYLDSGSDSGKIQKSDSDSDSRQKQSDS